MTADRAFHRLAYAVLFLGIGLALAILGAAAMRHTSWPVTAGCERTICLADEQGNGGRQSRVV